MENKQLDSLNLVKSIDPYIISIIYCNIYRLIKDCNDDQEWYEEIMDELDSTVLADSKCNLRYLDSLFNRIDQKYMDIRGERLYQNHDSPTKLYTIFIDHIVFLIVNYQRTLQKWIVRRYLKSSHNGSKQLLMIKELIGIEYITDEEWAYFNEKITNEIFHPLNKSWCGRADISDDKYSIEIKIIRYFLTVNPINNSELNDYYQLLE